MNSINTRKLRHALLGAAMALPGVASAQVSISSADGTTGADTYLTNDSNSGATAVKGTNGSIELRNWTTVRMRLTLLRFDVSGLDGASDNTGATISLAQTYGANRSRDWLVYGLRDGYDNSGVNANMTESWDESTTSYDTAPGVNGPGANDATYSIDIYDAGTNPTGAWELLHTETAWGINGVGGGPATMPTADLKAFIDADTDGQVSFLLVTSGAGDSSQYYGMACKEDGVATAADYPTLVLPVGTAGDSDGDGLADAWELANFGDLDEIGTGDPDLDTHDNEAEETAGSDPNNILSIPSDTDADGLADAWEITNFGDIVSQDGAGDPDADWGTNEDEETAGTDPNDRASFDDTADTDLQNDWWEIQYFGDTSTSTAGTDNPDGDADDNDAEYAAYSNPNDILSVPGDIDGDGVPDIWEDQYYGNNDGIITDVNLAADLDGTDGSLDNEPDGFTDLDEANAIVPSDPFDASSVPDNADGDTLSDAWELIYFVDIFGQNGLQDDDNDLYTNEEEQTGGTDPTDNLDFVDDIDADDINDRWEMLYFGTLDGGAGGTDDFFEDSDLDGFFNDEEYDVPDSNPNDIDSIPGDVDGDGLDDENFEIPFFGDIYAYDGSDDPDRDYSTNEEEENALTDPTDRGISPDTDFDGLGDGWEIFSFGDITTTDDPLADLDTDDGTAGGAASPDGYDNATEYANATNGRDRLSTPDDDGDGLPDGYELVIWGDTATQTGADDSDGGGASNRLEFLAGTDPDDAGVDDPSPGEITTAIGNGADTMLTNDNQNAFYNPNTPHGDAPVLEARNNTDARQRITLLRFDVSNLSGDLSNLMLQINCNAAPRTRALPIYGLVDGDPNENWDEATTTYLTGPGLIAADVGLINQFARDPKQLRPLGTLDIAQGVTGLYLTDPSTVDLESFVAADTDGIVTIAIAGVDNNQFQFDSKESANPAPTLLAPLGVVTVPTDFKVTSITHGPVAGEVHLTWESDGLASSFLVRGASDLSTAVSTWTPVVTGIANGGATTSTTLTGQTGDTMFYVVEEE